ncbi:hypothetical protein [Halomarina ordinaria]|uniref:DUF2178 domain-containing protein n=1 Tax=Halomarina ordinaria TaxID=3033939 RepID=A0ABD5U6U0_9EURY|nr:hypothetical protein [Halomarina sp. PSRA2]
MVAVSVPLQSLPTLGYFLLLGVVTAGLLAFWAFQIRRDATPADPANRGAWLLGGLALLVLGGASAALVGGAMYLRVERDVPYHYVLVVGVLAFALHLVVTYAFVSTRWV